MSLNQVKQSSNTSNANCSDAQESKEDFAAHVHSILDRATEEQRTKIMHLLRNPDLVIKITSLTDGVTDDEQKVLIVGKAIDEHMAGVDLSIVGAS